MSPVPVQEEITFEGSMGVTELVGAYPNYIRDPETGIFKAWYQRAGTHAAPGLNLSSILCYAESDDGIHWKKPDLGFAKQYGFDTSLCNAVSFDVYPSCIYKVTYDPFDVDPQKRYKLACINIEGDIWDNNITGWPFTSPDGISWKIIPGSEWYKGRMGTDGNNQIQYNPITERYQISCRPSCLDRRIALVESKDLIHWTDPMVVLQPDALDDDLLQFYSISQYWYHDHFIGILQRHHIAETETSGGVKWAGKVDDEIVYSYNGIYWLRSKRESLLPRAPLGEFASEQVYTSSMIELEDGSLRFYSMGDIGEHFGAEPIEGIECKNNLFVSEMRQCGFVCLEPAGGYGYFTTRVLIPRNGDLRLNYKAPNGVVRVQVSNKSHQPISGFSFEDFVELRGDDTSSAVSWKEGKTIDDFIGNEIRLEFQLFQAQIYAIDWDFQIRYGDPIIERI